MNTLNHLLQNTNLTGVVLDTALKSFIVLGLAGGACLGLRRLSAAGRFLIWFLAVLSLPFLPLLTSMTPKWHRPLWSISSGISAGNELSLAIELNPRANGSAPPGNSSTATMAAHPPSERSTSSQVSRLAAHFNLNWLGIGLAIWAVGMLLVLLSLLQGRRRLSILTQDAKPAVTYENLLSDACRVLSVNRPVVLLRSASEVMPITWGSWRHFILLPAEAEHWPEERVRVVLLHELAHIKRRDCLTQAITSLVCAIYWFNPLVWLAARSMRIERERACDDLVLNGGCKASDYATHLLEIARTFRSIPGAAAIAMARSSRLEERISAIVDNSRKRRAPSVVLVALGSVLALGLIAGLAAEETVASATLRKQQISRLQTFSAAKQEQATKLAAAANEKISPKFQSFFEAAIKGDTTTVTNMYADFKRHHPQYSNRDPDESLSTSYWQPVLEICLAYFDTAAGEPKYTQMAVTNIIGSIPPQSIYFGGTDPGRGLITAFSKSQIDGDPFFTLTQNALADSSYLEYLRQTYGGKLNIPSDEDSKRCYEEYSAAALQRLQHDQNKPNEPNQVRPGEDIRVVDGKVRAKGQWSVMAVNALLTKILFDRNPSHEFYVEESFPLDWMYPRLTPNGFILKLNRESLAELKEDVVARDRTFWRERVDGILGNWLTPETSVQAIVDFVEKVYVRKDLNGFTGDSAFVRKDYPQRMVSKWRSVIGGLYAWRIVQSKSPAEQKRMLDAADFAFRQAYALSPSSPEALFRYVNLLMSLGRLDDAILIVEAARKVDPSQKQFDGLLEQLRSIKGQQLQTLKEQQR